MQLIANSPLRLSAQQLYVLEGEAFDVPDEVAKQLLYAKKARIPAPPTVIYETKVIVPEAPTVRPRDPFRDVPMRDAQPPAVAPESDPLLPTADLSASRTAHYRGRGRRAGSASR